MVNNTLVSLRAPSAIFPPPFIVSHTLQYAVLSVRSESGIAYPLSRFNLADNLFLSRPPYVTNFGLSFVVPPSTEYNLWSDTRGHILSYKSSDGRVIDEPVLITAVQWLPPRPSFRPTTAPTMLKTNETMAPTLSPTNKTNAPNQIASNGAVSSTKSTNYYYFLILLVIVVFFIAWRFRDGIRFCLYGYREI